MRLSKFEWDKLFIFAAPQVICYEDDDGGDDDAAATAAAAEADDDDAAGDDDDAAGDDDDAAATAAAAKKSSPFSADQQKLVNRLLKKEREQAETKAKRLRDLASKNEKRMEAILKRADTSDALRASTETELEELRASLRTAEQQREYDVKKAAETHESETKALKLHSDRGWELYRSSSIERELTDAAVVHEAFNNKHIVKLLLPETEMLPVKDVEGNDTDQFAPMTLVIIKDEVTGDMVQKHVTPNEAVKLLKDDPNENGGLFKSSVIAGIGSGTATGARGGSVSDGANLSNIPMDEFAKRFNEDRTSVGLKPKSNF